ncbi:sulfide dehydrogenase [Rhodobacteraceae bacterium 2376]|uniref:Sulfide dehydrogenase n=1 Tax=Rhabdonatronobacter sediminivivens TaxID=2743469 RepID=A0A7Z0KXZ7_9RHOB|nr:sulfide dehydrogenase [Rhabdonatronobacter sediminivivens]NYS24859.1 sulfide dehydrogenase [Rhabdonatronobacter sediminivivens]
MTRKQLLAVSLLAGIAATGAKADDRTPLLAQSCAGCHGQSGEGMGEIARIAGYDRTAFIAIWEEFRNDERPATIMNRIARGYTDDEVAILADYFSSIE